MTHDQQESEKKGKALKDERDALMAKVQKARELRNRNNAPQVDETDDCTEPGNDKKRRAKPSHQAYRPGTPAGGSTGSAMGGSSIRKKDQAG